MALVKIDYPVSGSGEYLFGDILAGYDQVRIYFALDAAPSPVYENYKYFSPKSFYGKVQFFDEEAVALDVDLSFSCQRIYSRDSCCGASFEDRCRKYVCLASKLDWIGRAISIAFPAVIPVIGPYPLTSDAANYGEVLYRDAFTSFGYEMEPGATGVVTLVADTLPLSVCTPPEGVIPGPKGCRVVNSPPPPPGTCRPSVPPVGGGS